MSAERVVVTRTEIRQVRDKAAEILAIANSILKRPEPAPVETDEKGWPVIGNPEEQP